MVAAMAGVGFGLSPASGYAIRDPQPVVVVHELRFRSPKTCNGAVAVLHLGAMGLEYEHPAIGVDPAFRSSKTRPFPIFAARARRPQPRASMRREWRRPVVRFSNQDHRPRPSLCWVGASNSGARSIGDLDVWKIIIADGEPLPRTPRPGEPPASQAHCYRASSPHQAG